MPPRLSLKGIGKRYQSGGNDCVALHNISLTLDEGEFLAIQGPSGSGKTSLLNICGLIDRPSTGQYQFNGANVDQLKPREQCLYRRRDIGFIFQHYQLISTMTVFENIAYPLLLNGVARKQRKLQATRLLKSVGLSHRHTHLPPQLSGGEQQRVAIARALVKRPQLVIADEPSANLDRQHTEDCMVLMRELNKDHGASFLVASHDDRVIVHCDRVIHLMDGGLS